MPDARLLRFSSFNSLPVIATFELLCANLDAVSVGVAYVQDATGIPLNMNGLTHRTSEVAGAVTRFAIQLRDTPDIVSRLGEVRHATAARHVPRPGVVCR